MAKGNYLRNKYGGNNEPKVIKNIESIQCKFEPLNWNRTEIIDSLTAWSNFCTLVKADGSEEKISTLNNIYISKELSLGRFEKVTGWGQVRPFASGQTIFTFKNPQNCRLSKVSLYCDGKDNKKGDV